MIFPQGGLVNKFFRKFYKNRARNDVGGSGDKCRGCIIKKFLVGWLGV